MDVPERDDRVDKAGDAERQHHGQDDLVRPLLEQLRLSVVLYSEPAAPVNTAMPRLAKMPDGYSFLTVILNRNSVQKK